MQQATSVLIKTISRNKQILIIIDSDCDGFTSSAILVNYLHDLFPTWTETKIKYIVHKGKEHGLNDHINDIL